MGGPEIGVRESDGKSEMDGVFDANLLLLVKLRLRPNLLTLT